MIHAIHRRKGRRAVAAVEFAVVLPVILTMLLGIWEVGRMIEIQQILHNACREGGRQASTGQLTGADVQDLVKDYLNKAGLPTTNLIVTVTDLDTANADLSGQTSPAVQYLDRIQVSASIPVADVRWSVISLITTPGERVASQVQWITMVDKAYPTSPTPPQG